MCNDPSTAKIHSYDKGDDMSTTNASSSTYNRIANYNQHPFYFQVSPMRQEALDAQVSMCQHAPGPTPNRFSCHGALQRGGYDACSGPDGDTPSCQKAPQVPGIS
ncbi:hypothetical protein EBZ80_13985 [bacterium]|nr:hypothetical protein [bacterium]